MTCLHCSYRTTVQWSQLVCAVSPLYPGNRCNSTACRDLLTVMTTVGAAVHIHLEGTTQTCIVCGGGR